MSNTTGGYATSAAIIEKQHQDQSSIILKGASYAFRSAGNQKLIDQALATISAICTSADKALTPSIAAQMQLQVGALTQLIGSIQTGDLKAIAKRATLSQPQLKTDSKKLNQVDADLVTGMSELGKTMQSDASSGSTPQPSPPQPPVPPQPQPPSPPLPPAPPPSPEPPEVSDGWDLSNTFSTVTPQEAERMMDLSGTPDDDFGPAETEGQ